MQQLKPSTEPAPTVAVLLATYNGLSYLPQQLESITRQRACKPTLWVSDDESTDGTWEWLNRPERADALRLLPRIGRFGNAARNFYRLLRDADLTDCDYVSLADQDDIWLPVKLELSIERLRSTGTQGFSSNVLAFWPDGRQKLLQKAQQQRRLDFLFESGGPGCSYVLTATCARELQRFVRHNWDTVTKVEFHDWMIYAWARANGYRWHIEPTATIRYRQHGSNEFGANSGPRALARRLRHVRSGWYQQQIKLIASLTAKGCNYTKECADTIALVGAGRLRDRLRLLAKVHQMRRAPRDRLLLLFACLSGGL